MPISYQGGKKRFAKDIYEAITDYEYEITGENKMSIFSPFAGMLSIELELMKNDNRRKIIANDLNSDLILFWKGLLNGWKPKKYCNESKYNSLKKSKNHSKERGYCLTAFGFGGIFGGGYRPKYQNKYQSTSQTESQYNKLLDVVDYFKEDGNKWTFKNKNYIDFNPKGKLIYADPPYKSSLKKSENKYLRNFDIDEFWETMIKWGKNNLVFVSEEHIPSKYKKYFKLIWKKDRKKKIGTFKGRKSTEKLYVYERQ